MDLSRGSPQVKNRFWRAALALGAAALFTGSLFGVAHAGEQSGGLEETGIEKTVVRPDEENPADAEGWEGFSDDDALVPEPAEKEPSEFQREPLQGARSLDVPNQNGRSLGDSGDDEGTGVSMLSFAGETPYLVWEVDVEAPGSSFALEGPAVRSGRTGSWGDPYDVPDCVMGPCAGPDLDPAPGKYLVEQVGGHRVSSTSRYRITPTESLTGRSFLTTQTVEIPGDRATPSVNAWSNGEYDFGTFDTLANTPSCEAGYVYSITSGGQLKQVAPDGTVGDIGVSAGVANMNGLGVGEAGVGVFAYGRTTTGVNNPTYGIRVYEFDVDLGTWARAGVGRTGGTGPNKDQISTPGSIPVGGAMCSCTGTFFMGGFNTAGTEFHLYMYDPASNVITSLGKISTPDPGSGVHNGDIVFDSVGNLYLLRSSASSNSASSSTLTVFSVLAEDLKDADEGTTLQASALDDVTITMGAANGVAFDSAGKAYLQVTPNTTSGSLSSFDLPKYNNRHDILTAEASFAGVTDLASCSAPPSIRLQKEVMGGRFLDTDQFELTLHDGDDELVATTTEGDSTGVQSQVAGPVLTERGVDITFAESFTGSDNYATTYKCVGTDTTPLADDPSPVTILEGSSTSGTVRIPTAGEVGGTKGQIVCTLYNSPLKGSVAWTKKDGEGTLLAGSEWTISGPGFASVGEVVTDCAAGGGNETACTGLDKDPIAGKFRVEPLAYGDYSLIETKAPEGYVKDPKTHVFTISEEEKDVVIPDGETVNVAQPTITLLKETCGTEDPGNPEGHVPCNPLAEVWVLGENWELTAAGAGAYNPNANEETGWSVTGQDGSAGTWTLDMPDGSPVDVRLQEHSLSPPWRLQEVICKAEEQTRTLSGDDIDADLSVVLSGVEAGSAWTCTFRNRVVLAPDPGTVTWAKVGENGERLADSEWEVVGPIDRVHHDEDSWEITDCTDTAQCPEPEHPNEENGFTPADGDRDPSVGAFKIEGLKCGDYTLTETKAPMGYKKLKDPIEFTIAGTCNTEGEVNPNTKLGNIANELAGPQLPLTGGASAFTYLFFGGGLLGLAGSAGAVLAKSRSSKAGE